jgi:predicted transcriptional regulator
MSIENITVLLMLKKHGRMGRYSLSSTTGIGEGIVRRVLNELRDQGAIRVLRGGAELTEVGEELLSRLLNDVGVVFLEEDNSFMKVFNCECHRCYISIIKRDVEENDVIRLRDIAIKNGADAVIFLRYDCVHGKFLILRLNNYFEDLYKDFSERLHNLPNTTCGATMVIACGQNDYHVIKSIISVIKA